MNRLITSIIVCFVLGACSTAHRVNGWYAVADSPDNKIERKAIVTTEDFDVVILDTEVILTFCNC